MYVFLAPVMLSLTRAWKRNGHKLKVKRDLTPFMVFLFCFLGISLPNFVSNKNKILKNSITGTIQISEKLIGIDYNIN